MVFRSDESGTTDNFQKYLDAASNGAWGKGAGKTFNGGVGEGAKGNEGTSAAIKSTAGFDHLQRVVLRPGAEPERWPRSSPRPVRTRWRSAPNRSARPSPGAKIKGQGNDLVLDTSSFYKPTQTGAYPIVLATYEIVCSKYPDAETGTAVKAFLQSTIGAGQDGLADNGYIPIPDTFKAKLTTAINAIA